MSDRSLSRASWAAFVGLTVALYLVSSCARGSESESENDAGTEPSVATAATTAAERQPDEPVVGLPPDGNPEVLSEWSQLEIRDGQLVALDGVTPFTLNTALFSDYAHKLRTVSIPDGAAAAMYDRDETFDFPVGTVITKTFYYPVDPDSAADETMVLRTDPGPEGVVAPLDLADVRLVETRILVLRDDGWDALPYVWNDDETEATLQRTGDLVSLTLVSDGAESPLEYVVPDVNQCASCHAVDHSSGDIEPIGPKARHLNGEIDLGDGPEPQLAYWQQAGLLTGAPAATEIPRAADWNDDGVPVDDRARAYLDINCAHCHNEVGAADTSGLVLDIDAEVGFEFGVCKNPVAAGAGTGGRRVGILPGEPDESIFVFRMESTDPAAMMPELGRTVSHAEGVDLVSRWIESLDGEC